MDEKKNKPGCPKLSQVERSLTRREFVSTSSKLIAGSVIAATVGLPGKAWGSNLKLPSWKSATAKSDIFVVKNIPAPRYSLAGGTLPAGPSNLVLRDAGIEALVSLMNKQGRPFFRTVSAPQGLVAQDSVVVIKPNCQWVGFGSNAGAGRLSTSTDLLKGLIWRILNHPEGFTGEVVVAENHQGENWDFATRTPSNAQDQYQTLANVITVFQGLGKPVSLMDWSTLNSYLLPGGNLSSTPASTEYSMGNMDDGYVLLNDNTTSGDKPTNGYSYPKFQTAGGRYISMRHGLWDGSAYHSDRLVLINMPVLKKHCMAYTTSAWKNLVGFLTIADTDSRFGALDPDVTAWDNMHRYFWGYQIYTNIYGLLGRQISLIRKPDLNIVDAIWVATENNYGSSTAVRCNVILGSCDPFAVDWYASEYLLRPFVQDDPNWSSLARGGMFRIASVVIQKAAMNTWVGTYPFVDFASDYYGSTPRDDEKNQMNVFLSSALNSSMMPSINLLLER
jgi:hypothetical protein